MTARLPIEKFQLPVIDISPLTQRASNLDQVAQQIYRACCDTGFFYIVGHNVDESLQHQLEDLSRQFFAQDLETKLRIRMALAGRSWRGYFPVGGELTSGLPDLKEGIYFGAELDPSHPAVQARIPMHGVNLFPELPLFRETVLKYLAALTQLSHTLMAGIALSLGLEGSYFHERYTSDPLILFRIFNYPPDSSQNPAWGVGEHTDYGLLTILKQDEAGGLQVKSKSGWIDAPPIANSFVCNIGDMLDRLTRGLYRSTPHRVKNGSGRDRLSFPFFFDPNFNAELHPIELKAAIVEDQPDRWDGASLCQLEGTYGDYVLSKVAKVFPDLHQEAL